MTDIYTITLNSVDGVNTANKNDITYAFDWNVIPQGRYELRFNFLGESLPYFALGSLPQIYVALNQNNSLTTPSSWGAIPTTFLGNLYPIQNLGNGVNFFAGYLDNTPNILESIPTGSTINVRVRNKFGNFWSGNFPNTGYVADMPANSQVITISGPRTSGYPLFIGGNITTSGKTFTLESPINVNPTSGLGTYTTIQTNDATAIVASAVTTGNPVIGVYTMTLQLKRIS